MVVGARRAPHPELSYLLAVGAAGAYGRWPHLLTDKPEHLEERAEEKQRYEKLAHWNNYALFVSDEDVDG